VEITDERTLAVLNLTEENNNYIKNVLPVKMEEFQKQIDGAVESFFYEYDPSLDNEPASLWDTDAKKKMHLADTFTNINTGYSWRWALIDNEYQWIEISDTAIVEALLVAGRAQDTADQKRRTFTDIPYTPYDEGDLWVQGEKGDIMRCIFSREKGEFNPADWEKAGKYTDDSALEFFINGDYKNQLNEIKQQIDTRAETWYQATDPALQWTTASLKELHIGDLWYDTKKDQTFMWNGVQWVTQGVPDEVFDKIDGKAAIYVEQPE
jgi:phage-related protein